MGYTKLERMRRRQALRLSAAVAGSFMTGNLIRLMTSSAVEQHNFKPVVRIVHLAGQPVRVHGLPTGTVSVRRSHRDPGLGLPQILLDPRWTEPLPIYTWLIEHPGGAVLVDTGEQVRALQPGHYACDSTTGWVNRRILRFQLSAAEEIDARLAQLGLRADAVALVILTHLHLDHVDGLHHFPKAEVIVSAKEWQRPYGAMPCRLPAGLRPRLITFRKTELPGFSQALALDDARKLWLVSTPGHTYGHQSVLLQADEADLLFAGDAAFSQEQLLRGEMAGICADKSAGRATYREIRQYAGQRPLVFLPSHDPHSGRRLLELEPLDGGS